MPQHRLTLAVFLVGAVVMVLELVGSRILAPFVGATLPVWAGLIGVILGSLSLGYSWGGRLADRNPAPRTLSRIILLAAVWMLALPYVDSSLLGAAAGVIPSLRLRALVDALVLFAVPTMLLGMASPYAMRLSLADVNTSGRTAGYLYAVSTLGSIVGTFLAGFLLIQYFGNARILVMLAFTLLVASFLVQPRGWLAARAVVALAAAGSLPLLAAYARAQAAAGFIDTDTQYARVWIYSQGTGRPVREMRIGNQPSSAMYLDGSGDLVYPYTRYYRLAAHFVPGLQSGLMLGGGAYSYPRDFLRRFPQADLDVVEIDAQVSMLARQYFGLKDDPRLRIFAQDGRTFLNQPPRHYDVIFGDAFGANMVPHQLTTLEAARAMRAALHDQGAVIINLVSALSGDRGRFLRAEVATFREAFPQVHALPVSDPDHPEMMQNVMLIALTTAQPPSWQDADPELNGYLAHRYRQPLPTDVAVLTDDYAPVESMTY